MILIIVNSLKCFNHLTFDFTLITIIETDIFVNQGFGFIFPCLPWAFLSLEIDILRL